LQWDSVWPHIVRIRMERISYWSSITESHYSEHCILFFKSSNHREEIFVSHAVHHFRARNNSLSIAFDDEYELSALKFEGVVEWCFALPWRWSLDQMWLVWSSWLTESFASCSLVPIFNLSIASCSLVVLTWHLWQTICTLSECNAWDFQVLQRPESWPSQYCVFIATHGRTSSPKPVWPQE